MKTFIDITMRHSRMVLLSFVFLLVAGWMTYRDIPKEANPDVPIPYIYTIVSHEGISPEDAERLLIRPLETELRNLQGLKQMTAHAKEGSASILLEFNPEVNQKQALADVRDRVSMAKAKLPQETEEPIVREVTMADEEPAVVLVLSGLVPESTLVSLARQLRDQLETIPGVLEVPIKGDREDMLEIIIDPLKLENYGLSPDSIFNLVARNNRLVAAGTLDTGQGRFAIKVPGIFKNLRDIMEMPIKVSGDKVVTFQDVATLRRSYKDATEYARLNGKPAIALEIQNRPGENVITTVDKAKAMVQAAQAQWPQGMEVYYRYDNAKEIKEMLNELENSIATAILLVMIVIVSFLGLRTALLVGVAIPGSFLPSILILKMMGLTMNNMVLFALVMSVGMLVDGAVVVTEFADRKMSEGLAKWDAYAVAAKRMAWPIFSSIATTIAAFVPLLFWPGITGEFMKYLPITVIATLGASLVSAFVFVPTLGKAFGKRRYLSNIEQHNLHIAEQGDLSELKGFYQYYIRVLRVAVHNPWKSLGFAVLLSISAFVAYGMFGKGVEYFPSVDASMVRVTVRARGDLSLEEKDRLVREVEQRFLKVAEIESVYLNSGNIGRGDEADRIGNIRLRLIDWRKRRNVDEIVEDIRARVADIAGVNIEVQKAKNGPSGGGKPLHIELSSAYPELLDDAVAKVRQAVAVTPGFIDIEDSRPLPGIEWQMRVDRAAAARFGADISSVGSAIQLVTNGIKISEYRPDDVTDEIDIRVRFPFDERHIEQLDKLRITTKNGLVPISNFVERVPMPQVDTIERVDGKRVMNIQADVAPGLLLDNQIKLLHEKITALNLDPKVMLSFKGEKQEQDEAAQFLVRAFVGALFLIMIILVAEFNSFYQAFLILTGVVFSTVGVVLGLLIMQKPFGIIMSGIGVIALAGVVVHNNIVLIDTYNVLRREGAEAIDAILRCGVQRFRPVLLTAVTAILGLFPMAIELNIDLINREVFMGGASMQWWSQMASAVAGGLTFATALTLILTPCMLAVGVDIQRRIQQRRAKTLVEKEMGIKQP